MQRSIQQLVAVFILLTAIAWWITGRVAISHSMREFFLGDEETSTPPETPPGEQEKVLIEKALAELPPPPAEHSPEVAELISRLEELQPIPAILVNAVKRDQETPKDQTPTPWSEAELEALKNYQAKFREAWEPFLSGPQPDWEKFPDSAILFRSRLFLMEPDQEINKYASYRPQNSLNREDAEYQKLFFQLRLLRQCSGIGTLRHGYSGSFSFNFSGWTLTDTVNQVRIMNDMLRDNECSFGFQIKSPEEVLSCAPAPPTTTTLRNGLKTDRAVFLKTAEYLESLPPQTPAEIGLTRLLEDERDAKWFARHLNDPPTAREMASILRQGAEQIGSLEQKTYLSGPAWRQWLTGDLNNALSPALKGTLEGMREFELIQMEYQVTLAFLQASVAYRKTGLEGMKSISDPARPGSFLTVTSSTNEITLSSAFQKNEGEDFSFTFEPLPSP